MCEGAQRRCRVRAAVALPIAPHPQPRRDPRPCSCGCVSFTRRPTSPATTACSSNRFSLLHDSPHRNRRHGAIVAAAAHRCANWSLRYSRAATSSPSSSWAISMPPLLVFPVRVERTIEARQGEQFQDGSTSNRSPAFMQRSDAIPHRDRRVPDVGMEVRLAEFCWLLLLEFQTPDGAAVELPTRTKRRRLSCDERTSMGRGRPACGGRRRRSGSGRAAGSRLEKNARRRTERLAVSSRNSLVGTLSLLLLLSPCWLPHSVGGRVGVRAGRTYRTDA